jgi:hypothetical protein
MSNLMMKWPLMRQIFNGGDGAGAEATSEATRNLRPKWLVRSAPIAEWDAGNSSFTKTAS